MELKSEVLERELDGDEGSAISFTTITFCCKGTEGFDGGTTTWTAVAAALQGGAARVSEVCKVVTLRWFSVTKVQFEFEVGFGFEFVIVDKRLATGVAMAQLEFELLIRILEAMIASDVFLSE